MPLEHRQYRLGCSDDCDIVLHDSSLPEVLLSLDVDDSGISLSTHGECTLLHVNGERIDEQLSMVTAFDIYTVGTLHFCFGITGEVWPALSIPTLRNVESNSEEPNVKESAELGLATADERPWFLKLRDVSKITVNLSVLLCFVVCGLIFYNGHLDANVVSQKPVLDVKSLVQQDMGFEKLSVTSQDNSNVEEGANLHWTISGYVNTQGELGKLKRRLTTSNLPITLDIRVMDDIQRSTETLLKQFELNSLQVQQGDIGGELMVSGVHGDPEEWRRIKALLVADIPGLARVVDQVESQESRLQMLNQWISDEKLEDDVTVTLNNGQLTLSSDIALEKSEAWRRIQDRFERMFGESLAVSASSSGRPKIDIRSVSLGSIPYLILSNGRRYTAGSYIRDGFYVEKIDKNSVVFKRGIELIKYRVGMRNG